MTHTTDTTESTTTTLDLAEALSESRIPWAAIEAAGYDLQAIADEAGAHGDAELRRRALRAIARRA